MGRTTPNLNPKPASPLSASFPYLAPPPPSRAAASSPYPAPSRAADPHPRPMAAPVRSPPHPPSPRRRAPRPPHLHHSAQALRCAPTSPRAAPSTLSSPHYEPLAETTLANMYAKCRRPRAEAQRRAWASAPDLLVDGKRAHRLVLAQPHPPNG
ncbi:unnamed protein product [Urochloa humidicola]